MVDFELHMFSTNNSRNSTKKGRNKQLWAIRATEHLLAKSVTTQD